MGNFRYILGDSDREVKRLAFQAGVWADMSESCWDRLGVGPGWRCLEIGAGTGTTLFPLARRVRGRGGRVDAVERSPKYADYLRRKACRLRLSNVSIIESEILEAPLADGAYDLIYARWVFLFLPRVEEHLRRLVRALRPGGRLAVQDYHRGSMAMYPSPPHWRDLVLADTAWFASQGGDINIGGSLPGLFRRAGLKDIEAKPWTKAGNPASNVWKWAEAYFIGYLDQMSRFPPMTAGKTRAFRAGWMSSKRDPGALFISPTVMDVTGRKPR